MAGEEARGALHAAVCFTFLEGYAKTPLLERPAKVRCKASSTYTCIQFFDAFQTTAYRQC